MYNKISVCFLREWNFVDTNYVKNYIKGYLGKSYFKYIKNGKKVKGYFKDIEIKEFISIDKTDICFVFTEKEIPDYIRNKIEELKENKKIVNISWISKEMKTERMTF